MDFDRNFPTILQKILYFLRSIIFCIKCIRLTSCFCWSSCNLESVRVCSSSKHCINLCELCFCCSSCNLVSDRVCSSSSSWINWWCAIFWEGKDEDFRLVTKFLLTGIFEGIWNDLSSLFYGRCQGEYWTSTPSNLENLSQQDSNNILTITFSPNPTDYKP